MQVKLKDGMCPGQLENISLLPQIKLKVLFPVETKKCWLHSLDQHLGQLVHVSCSVVSNSCVTLWSVARQAPLSMEFSRQEYWSGLAFTSPGDLPNPGIKPGSPVLQTDFLPSEPPVKPQHTKSLTCLLS